MNEIEFNNLKSISGCDAPIYHKLENDSEQIEQTRLFLSKTRQLLLANVESYPATIPLKNLYEAQQKASQDEEIKPILKNIADSFLDKANLKGKWKSKQGQEEMKSAIKRCRYLFFVDCLYSFL